MATAPARTPRTRIAIARAELTTGSLRAASGIGPKYRQGPRRGRERAAAPARHGPDRRDSRSGTRPRQPIEGPAGMLYRSLGRTGARVSAFSVGAMLFGGTTTSQEAARLVDLALDRGINSIDT